MMLCPATGNIGNMPLVIIGAVCRDETNPFGLDPDICNTKGVAYISFGQWVCVTPIHRPLLVSGTA